MSGATIWARNDIRRGWTSLVIVALLVAIAGGAVMAGVAGARRAGASVDRYLADTGLSDATIYTQSPLDPELRSELVADPRVADVADMRVVLAAPATVRPGQDSSTLVVPDEYWGDLIRPRLVEGTYPSGPDEIAMTELAGKFGFAVGQVVDMKILTPALLEKCVTTGECDPDDAGTATITATLRFPDDLAPGPYGQGVFVAPAAFLEARGGDANATGHITDLYLRPGAVIDEVVNDYSTKVSDGDVRNANSDVVGARRAAELQRNALLIGTGIAAVAGLLIAGQGFGRFLSRRSSEARTLAALGMPGGQRTMAGWMPGLTAAALGALLAVPIAIVLSPLFPLRGPRRADPDVGVHADLQVLVPGALVIFAIGAASALLSASLWSRTRDSESSGTTVSLIYQLAVRLRLTPVPTMGSRFALEPGRGTRRAPVLPALAGSVAAIAVIVGALVLAASLDGLLDTPARYGAPWDLQVPAGQQEEVRAGVTADDRVEGAALAGAGELNISVNGSPPNQVFAVGIEPLKGSVEPVVLDGRAPSGPDEVLIGSDLLERLGLALGDRIDVSGPGGDQTMTVVGRAIVPIVGSSQTDDGIVVPLDTFRTLGGGELVAAIDAETVILTKLVDGADLDAFRTELEAAGLFVDGTFRQSSVTVLDEVREIPFYVAFFTAFIGALAVFHALVITARRRRRDLAILRAIGCRRRQTGAVIHWQGFFLAAAAIVLGVPIGLIGGRLLWNSIADGTNVLSMSETPWAAIGLVATAAVFGAAVVLATGPAWAAGRRRPGADLRTE
jgi:ABC-type lipoprotein release transport system permease subunit